MKEEFNHDLRNSGAAAADHSPLLAETPDFVMIYAFLGSMFDPVIHGASMISSSLSGGTEGGVEITGI